MRIYVVVIMRCVSAVVLVVLVSAVDAQNRTFPSWFMFGAATSAYQVEGGWNASDKGESTWDRLLHSHPDLVGDGTNGDVACDSYHLWRRDIQICEELGLDMYRFSISWPRLLPTGFPNHISEDGKNYYSNLIDGLLEKGIQPVVTMYHWDLPQYLQDLGGWANPLISEWFADYARILFSLYGDRVKYWITLNEPIVTCDSGYSKQSVPYLDDFKVGGFLCNKNLLMAHAKAYRIYDEEYRMKYHGKVSIANVFLWFEPETPDDANVTELMIQMYEGRYAHAIYTKLGGWPPELEKFLAENSRREGYKYPRLPPFTPEEVEFVRGTYDYYALNHYVSRLVRKVGPGEAGSWPFYGSEEIGATMLNDPSWLPTFIDWFSLNPKALRKQLHWMYDKYGDIEIMITENGMPLKSRDLQGRRQPMVQGGILLAINDGIRVIGYTAWSLMDNFEWMGGYVATFGMYSVDFSDPRRPRSPRESARYYSSVTRTRSLYPKRRGLNYE